MTFSMGWGGINVRKHKFKGGRGPLGVKRQLGSKRKNTLEILRHFSGSKIVQVKGSREKGYFDIRLSALDRPSIYIPNYVYM